MSVSPVIRRVSGGMPDMVVRSDKKRIVEAETKAGAWHQLGVSLRDAIESVLRASPGHLRRGDRVGGAVAAVLLECSSPDEILTRALHELLRSTRMDAGAVYLKGTADGDACGAADEPITLMCQEGFTSEAIGELASMSPGERLVGRVFGTGEVIAGELRSFSRSDASPWLTLGFRSFLGLPVYSGDRILGVLALLCQRRRVFSRLAQERLRAAGCVIGEAFQKSRVRKEMEDALLAARRLSRLPREFGPTVSPDRSLEQLAQAACELALALSSMIVLADAVGRPMRRASFGYSRKAAAAAARTDAVSARCLASKETVVISTPSQVREAIGEELLESGFASCICLPLRVGERPLGTLWLNYESPRTFSALEIEQLQGLADRVAAAIESAHRQTLALRQHGRYMELIGHIERVASRGTLKDMLQALSDAARELLSAEIAVTVFSRDNRSEQAVSVTGDAERKHEAASAPLRAPEIGAIAERASRLLYPVGRQSPQTDGETVHHMPGLLAKALLDEANASLGRLVVANKMEEADFSEEDADLLDTLGRHASVAIQNALKVEETTQLVNAYRNLLDDAPVAIATLDKKQTFTSVNRAFEDLTGFTKEELQGKITLFDLLPEMERKGAPNGGLGEPGDSAIVREVELFLVTKDSGQKKVKLSIGTAHNSGSVTVCLTDISASARAAIEEKPELSPVSLTTSRVLSAATTSLSTAIEQLQSLLHQNPPETLKPTLETTCKQTRACRATIEGLVVLNEPQSISEELLDLNDLLTSLVDEKAASLRQDGLGVVLRLDASLPVIPGDAARLRWALAELVEGACQMSRDIQRDQRLTIQTERIGDSGRVNIHIVPSAVSPEKLATLFDTPSGDEEDLLTRMSFAACRCIMERHGWRIHAEQKSESGVTFIAEFPLPVQVSNGETQTAPAVVEPPPDQIVEAAAEKRILVVDDERVVVDLLDYYLRSEGHAVDISRDGRAALKRLKESDYDLILCDIRMPEVSGEELFHWLEANKPRLADRIIFITGDVATPETLAFLHNPPKRWLEKPFDLTELRELIAEVLR